MKIDLNYIGLLGYIRQLQKTIQDYFARRIYFDYIARRVYTRLLQKTQLLGREVLCR